RGSAEVYAEMAQDFSHAVVSGFIAGQDVLIDPTLQFPVLLHWSFTSYGSTTFRSLVEGLDSGLLGTVGEDAQPTEGRLRLEVVVGRGLVEATVARPADLVGDPLPLVTAGRTLAVDGTPDRLLAQGYGLAPEVFKGDAVTVLGRLRDSTVLRPEVGLRAD